MELAAEPAQRNLLHFVPCNKPDADCVAIADVRQRWRSNGWLALRRLQRRTCLHGELQALEADASLQGG